MANKWSHNLLINRQLRNSPKNVLSHSISVHLIFHSHITRRFGRFASNSWVLCGFFKNLIFFVLIWNDFFSCFLFQKEMRSAHECHSRSSTLTIKCPIGHRIRILESFYAVSSDQSRDFCIEGYRRIDCKSFIADQNVCNGKTVCTVNLYKTFLSECNQNSDYLSINYECVPGK